MRFTRSKMGILVPLGMASMAGVAGTVRLSDAIVPTLFNSYTNEDTVELTAFADSGVIQSGELINNMVRNGGGAITLPFWNDLDSSEEPNYSNDDPTDMASPDKLSTGEQSARVAFLNNGWAAADLVQELAGSDPNSRIAARVDAYWARQWQKRLIQLCVGLYNRNVASEGGDMTVDATAYAEVSEQIFNVNNFVDAAFTLGDHVGSLGVVAMHSMVAKRVTKNNEVEDIRDSEGNLLYQVYKNARIVIDDSMPTFGSGSTRSYLSIMFGAGSIISGFGNPRVPTETDRTPRAGHGGGTEELWTRRTWLQHPKGYKFTGAKLTGNGTDDNGTVWKNASWADLRDATNWERVVDRKKVNLAFLLTRG